MGVDSGIGNKVGAPKAPVKKASPGPSFRVGVAAPRSTVTSNPYLEYHTSAVSAASGVGASDYVTRERAAVKQLGPAGNAARYNQALHAGSEAVNYFTGVKVNRKGAKITDPFAFATTLFTVGTLGAGGIVKTIPAASKALNAARVGLAYSETGMNILNKVSKIPGTAGAISKLYAPEMKLWESTAPVANQYLDKLLMKKTLTQLKAEGRIPVRGVNPGPRIPPIRPTRVGPVRSGAVKDIYYNSLAEPVKKVVKSAIAERLIRESARRRTLK
jgi:hypothetical protein